MKLSELREFIEKQPIDHDDYDVVISVVRDMEITTSEGAAMWARHDIPVEIILLDHNTYC
jgi:hypothetical protein